MRAAGPSVVERPLPDPSRPPVHRTDFAHRPGCPADSTAQTSLSARRAPGLPSREAKPTELVGDRRVPVRNSYKRRRARSNGAGEGLAPAALAVCFKPSMAASDRVDTGAGLLDFRTNRHRSTKVGTEVGTEASTEAGTEVGTEVGTGVSTGVDTKNEMERRAIPWSRRRPRGGPRQASRSDQRPWATGFLCPDCPDPRACATRTPPLVRTTRTSGTRPSGASSPSSTRAHSSRRSARGRGARSARAARPVQRSSPARACAHARVTREAFQRERTPSSR